jgi:hypothetical protein
VKKRFFYFFLLAVIFSSLSACAAIAGIFKAGMATGILMVVAFVALIIYVISKMGGRDK